MAEDPQAPGGEAELPPYIIEGARSSRARCKTCRRKIDKGALRIGVLVEGPYGTGHMWHHLTCAAKRRWDDVAEAYRAEAWREAKEPPPKVPDLAQLEELREKAEAARETRKTIPYIELDPSGRARCKQCGEPLPKGEPRVVIGREVEFGNQMRVGPVNIHPACVAAELEREDSAAEAEGLTQALTANSADLDPAALARALAQISR